MAAKFPIDEQKAINSSGSAITMDLRLFVTLRVFSGAAYLDMIWYGVNVDHVQELVLDTATKLDATLDNIRLPSTENEWEILASNWAKVQVDKRCWNLMPGTVLAGDGLCVEIKVPSVSDPGAQGLDRTTFYNRKGFHALVVQAFCDSDCMIRYWAMKWPGGVNDITAYKQSSLYHMLEILKSIPERFHMVLDEAYSSIGGNQHLTPYSKHQLRKTKEDIGVLEYLIKRAFNHILSSQRITIERVFGEFFPIEVIVQIRKFIHFSQVF